MICDDWSIEEIEVTDPETGEVVVYRRARCARCDHEYLTQKPLARCSFVCGSNSVQVTLSSEPLAADVLVQPIEARG